MIDFKVIRIYRCGWCGFPTDVNGKPLPLGHDAAVAYVREHASAEVTRTNGECCPGNAHVDHADLR